MREALSLRSWEHRPLLIAGGVVMIALLLALANPRGLFPHPVVPRPVHRAPIMVMVAAHPIAAGTVIAPADIRAKAYPNGPPIGATLSPEAVIGRVAIHNFASGEALSQNALRDPATAGIAMRVPAGERAFSIRVSEDEIVGGFLQSGDRVDIFATIPGSVFPAAGAQNQPDRSQALLLLQNVQVLAVGDNSATRGSIQSDARTVSLSLPPDRLARLALALRFGKLSLAIRKPGDNGVVRAATATLADLVPRLAASRQELSPASSRGEKSAGDIPFYAGTRLRSSSVGDWR